MQRSLFCILACLLTGIAHAQVRGTLKRGAAHVFLRFSGDWHINGSDEYNKDSRYDGLQVQDKIGCGLALEFQRMTRSRFYITGGGQIKIVPQEIQMNYDPVQAGFSSGRVLNESLSYTNLYAGLMFHVGYSALLSPHSAFDIDGGLNLMVPLNGKRQELRYYEPITSPDYTDLVAYRRTVWGSSSPLGLASLRLAYRGYQGVLFKDRSFRVGLESTILLSDDYTSRRNNSTELRFYGPNRQPLGTQHFYDRHIGLSLFVDVEL